MAVCVNTGSKEFRNLAKKHDVSLDRLEFITKDYWSEKNNTDSYPDDEYIQKKLGNDTYKESVSDTIDFWRYNYSGIRKFDNIEELNEAVKEAKSYFPSNAIVTYQDSKDNWCLRVKQPILNQEEKTFDEIINEIKENNSKKESGVNIIENYNNNDTDNIVFDSNQVKLSTDNIDTFSKEDDNIHNNLNVNENPNIEKFIKNIKAVIGKQSYNEYGLKNISVNVISQWNNRLWLPKRFDTKDNFSISKKLFNQLVEENGLNDVLSLKEKSNSIEVLINENNLKDYIEESNEILDLFDNSEESRQVLDILNFLNGRLGIKYKVVSVNEAKTHKGYKKNANAFVENDTAYFIKGKKLTADIAAEEMLHPFVAALKKNNKQEYDNLVAEAKKLFPKLHIQISEKYDAENVEEELLTQALSRSFKEERKNNPDGNKFNDFIKRFVDWIWSMFSSEPSLKFDGNLTLSSLSALINSDAELKYEKLNDLYKNNLSDELAQKDDVTLGQPNNQQQQQNIEQNQQEEKATTSNNVMPKTVKELVDLINESQKNTKPADERDHGSDHYDILENVKGTDVWMPYTRVHGAKGNCWYAEQNNYVKQKGQRAVEFGSIIDELLRDYFVGLNNDTLDLDSLKENFKKNYGEKFTDPDAIFDKFVGIMKNIQEQTKGETLLTNNIVLYNSFGNGTSIAGEVDIISVGTTKDGKISVKIYDLKTYNNYNLTTKAEPTKGQIFNKADDYAHQLALYKVLFENQFGIKVDDLKLITLQVTFNDPNNHVLGNKMKDINLSNNVGVDGKNGKLLSVVQEKHINAVRRLIEFQGDINNFTAWLAESRGISKEKIDDTSESDYENFRANVKSALLYGIENPNKYQTVCTIINNIINKYKKTYPEISLLNEYETNGNDENQGLKKLFDKITNPKAELNNNKVDFRKTIDIKNRNLKPVEFKDKTLQQPAQNLPGPETKINIYAGAGEHTELSNFAQRPFTITTSLGDEMSFNSVENAFQYHKLLEMYDEMDEDKFNEWSKKILEASPAQAKALGGKIPMSASALSRWNENSSDIMYSLIRASFEQNPDAAKQLLATGNATLTHTQDKGKWGTEFPIILMEVRNELKEGYAENAQTQQTVQQEQQSTFDVSKAEFYSGAANGADRVWGNEARALGIKVKDYTTQDWDNLSQEWKDKLDAEYQEVVKILSRKVLDRNSYAGKLVRRDMMQADKADAIFAIGIIDSNSLIKGGTGYATTRGIIRGIPVYVFDQSDSQWKMWDKNTKSFTPTSEPVLTPHAATIGTREINDAGRQAIKSVLTKTLNQQTDPNIPEIDKKALERTELSLHDRLERFKDDIKGKIVELPFVGKCEIIDIRYNNGFKYAHVKSKFNGENIESVFVFDDNGDFKFEKQITNNKSFNNKIKEQENKTKKGILGRSLFFNNNYIGAKLEEKTINTNEKLEKSNYNPPKNSEIVEKRNNGVSKDVIRKDFANELNTVFEILTEKANKAGIKVEFLTNEELEKFIDSFVIFSRRSENGRFINGFVKDNVIYINKESIKPYTIVHEYTHMWVDWIKALEPNLYKEGLNVMRHAKLNSSDEKTIWQEVEESENYGKRWKEDLDNGRITLDEYNHEMFSEVFARYNERFSENKFGYEADSETFSKKIKSFFDKVVRFLKSTLCGWSEIDARSLSSEDFANLTLRDLFEGKNYIHNVEKLEKQNSVDSTIFNVKSLDLDKYDIIQENKDGYDRLIIKDLTDENAEDVEILYNNDNEIYQISNLDLSSKELVKAIKSIIPENKNVFVYLENKNADNIKTLINEFKDFDIYGYSTEYKEDGSYIKIPIFRNKENKELKLSYQLNEIFSEKLLDEDGENVSKSLKLDANKVRVCANALANKISDMLDLLEVYDEETLNKFGIKEDDIKDLSRADIISKISLPKFIGVLRENLGDITLLESAQINYLLDNYLDSMLMLASPFIEEYEGFSLTENNVKIKLSDFATTEIDAENETEDVDVLKELFGSDIEHWQIKQRCQDIMNDLDSVLTKELRKCCFRDENGNVIMSAYGNKSRVPLRQAVQTILHLTQGCNTASDMAEVFSKNSIRKKYPWLEDITKKLKSKSGENSTFQSLFFKTFKKDHQYYSNSIKDRAGYIVSRELNKDLFADKKISDIITDFYNGQWNLLNLKKEVVKNKNGVEISVSRLDSPQTQIKGNDNKKLFALEVLNRIVGYRNNGNKHLTVDGFIGLQDFINFSENSVFRNENSNKLSSGVGYKRIENSKIKKAKDKFVNDENYKDQVLKSIHMMYNLIGINCDFDLVKDTINEKNIESVCTALSEMHRILYYNYGQQQREINNIKNSYKEKFENYYNPFKGNIETNQNDINGYLKEAIRPIVDVLSLENSSSFFASGNMYQSYTLPSYLTSMIQSLSGSKKERKEFIEREYNYDWFKSGAEGQFYTYSWIGQMYNNNIPIEHKVELNFLDKDYMSEMSPEEYTLSIINNYFSAEDGCAWYYMPMMSNKPSNEFLKFRTFSREEVVAGLIEMASQEINRIRTVKAENAKRKELQEELEQEKNKNHPNKNKINDLKRQLEAVAEIKNYHKRGQSFVMVEFLQQYLDNENVEIIKNNDGTIDTEANKKLQKYIKEDIPMNEEFKNLLNRAISSYMLQKSEIIYNKLESKGLLDQITKIKKINKDNTKDAIIDFIYNSYFAQLNILQMTVTDTAYYKDSEDLQKRLAQLHAPGVKPNVSAIDFGTYNYESGKFDYTTAKPICDGKMRTIILTDFDNVKSNIIENISIIYDRKIKEAKTEAEKESLKILKDNLIEQFSHINIADAQAYTSLQGYRKKMFMFGKMTEDAEIMIQKMMKGRTDGSYSLTDIKTAFQPLKPFVYTQIGQEGITSDGNIFANRKVPMQMKNSEYLLVFASQLFKENPDTGRPNVLKVLDEIMEESHNRTNGNGIDSIQFESAIKCGIQSKIDLHRFLDEGKTATESEIKSYINQQIYDENGNFRTNSTVKEFNAIDYKIQQEVPLHFLGHEQVQGSQERCIIPSDLHYEDDIFYEFYESSYNYNKYLGKGKKEYEKQNPKKQKLTAKEFREEYYKTISENIESSLSQLETELNLNNADPKVREKTISDILIKEALSNSRNDLDLIYALSINPETGKMRLPKNDPVQSKKIEQLLNSVIKNAINKQKIAGGPVVQVSNFGTSHALQIKFFSKELDKNDNRTYLLSKNEFLNKKSLVNKYDTYEKYIEECQGGISHLEVYAPAFQKDLFEKFKDPKTGEIDVKQIEQVCPEALEMIGYRIPTEDKYSIAPIKIVGFLPAEAGEGIMLPADITLLSGSDFDIDKLYIMRREFIFKKDKNGKMRAYSPKSKTAINNNKIIDMSLSVLQHEKTAPQILTPGGFEKQKQIGYTIKLLKLKYEGKNVSKETIKEEFKRLSKLDSSEIKKELEKYGKTDNLAWIDTQIDFYGQNSVAGRILGIFAVNKTAHAILESRGYRLDNSFLRGELMGKNSNYNLGGFNLFSDLEIDPQKDIDGNYIGLSLGNLVGASADAVKDPVLNLMNINKETINILTTLMRVGMPFDKASLFLSSKVFSDLLEDYNIEKLTNPKLGFSTFLKNELKNQKGIKKSELDYESISEDDMYSTLIEYSDEQRYKYMLMAKRILGMAESIQKISGITRYNSISNAVGPLDADNIVATHKLEKFITEEYVLTTQEEKKEFRDLRNKVVSKKETKEERRRYDYLLNKLNKAKNILGIEGKLKEGNDIVKYSGILDKDGNSIEAKDILNDNPMLLSFAKANIIASELFQDFSTRNKAFQIALRMMPEYVMNNRSEINHFCNFFNTYALSQVGVINKEVIDSYINNDKFINKVMSLKNTKELKDMMLFKQLYRVTDQKTGKDKLIIKTNGLNKNELNQIKMEWISLFNMKENFEGEKDLNGEKVSRWLFMYNICRSGLSYNPDTFINLCPSYVRENIELPIMEGNVAKKDANGNVIYVKFIDIINDIKNIQIDPYSLIIQYYANYPEKSQSFYTLKQGDYEITNQGEYRFIGDFKINGNFVRAETVDGPIVLYKKGDNNIFVPIEKVQSNGIMVDAKSYILPKDNIQDENYTNIQNSTSDNTNHDNANETRFSIDEYEESNLPTIEDQIESVEFPILLSEAYKNLTGNDFILSDFEKDRTKDLYKKSKDEQLKILKDIFGEDSLENTNLEMLEKLFKKLC